jgi:hypothetical protein
MLRHVPDTSTLRRATYSTLLRRSPVPDCGVSEAIRPRYDDINN